MIGRRPPGTAGARHIAGTGPGGGVANLALVLLTLATVASLSRLFIDPRHFVGSVLACGLTVHAAAWGCRRLRLGLLASAVLSISAGVFIVSWTVLAHQTFYGIPNRTTWHAAGTAIRASLHSFTGSAAPVPSTPGWVLAACLGVGTVAILADWAAFRMRATIEAVIPSFSLFVFSSALAQGQHVVMAAGAWLAALLVFLLVRQPAFETPAMAWFANPSRGGPGGMLSIGALIGAAALVIAAFPGPSLPGATTTPVFNWRQHGQPTRTASSPLVDIGSRLKQQAGIEVFTVTANRPAYWRQTALDTFDGRGWTLNQSYTKAGSNLGGFRAQGVPTATIDASFKLTALESIWLPAPYRPVGFGGASHVSFSSEVGSLLYDRDTTDGLTYQVRAEVPTLDPTVLRKAAPVAPDAALSRYLDLPAIPAVVRNDALRVTVAATTEYDKARALQDWFRTQFTYDLNVPADDGTNAIVSFLNVRRGFCQQFAGTFAVMARSLGIPARVAVGFTPGTFVDGAYHVRDDHAHSWPEVWFTGIGWVAFEPTPSRGNPQAEAYTGVPAQQVDTAPNQTPTAGGPTTTQPDAGSATAAPADVKQLPDAGNIVTPSRSSSSNRKAIVGSVLAVLALIVAAGVVTTPLAKRTQRRRRRRRAGDDPASSMALDWQEATGALALVGAGRRSAETPSEYADRVGRRGLLDAGTAATVRELSGAIARASYSPNPPGPELALTTTKASVMIRDTVRRTLPRWRRVLVAIDPRPLWDGGGSTRRA